jgi:hypothetical protein
MLLLLLLGLPELVAMVLLLCAAAGLLKERKDLLTRELSITGFVPEIHQLYNCGENG